MRKSLSWMLDSKLYYSMNVLPSRRQSTDAVLNYTIESLPSAEVLCVSVYVVCLLSVETGNLWGCDFWYSVSNLWRSINICIYSLVRCDLVCFCYYLTVLASPLECSQQTSLYIMWSHLMQIYTMTISKQGAKLVLLQGDKNKIDQRR
jgi:hypothetical protein